MNRHGSLGTLSGLARRGLLVVVLAAWPQAWAQADPINAVYSLSPTAWGKPSSSDAYVETYGWQFHANATFEVSHLGWYDRDGDGLESSHEIAIWDMNEKILARGVVQAGTANPFDNSFRWMEITPIVLQAGQDYVVAGTAHLDWCTSVGTYEVAPQIIYTGRRSGWPTTSGPITLRWPFYYESAFGGGYWGSNFRIVPEPTALLLLAGGGMAVLKRRGASRRA